MVLYLSITEIKFIVRNLKANKNNNIIINKFRNIRNTVQHMLLYHKYSHIKTG